MMLTACKAAGPIVTHLPAVPPEQNQDNTWTTSTNTNDTSSQYPSDFHQHVLGWAAGDAQPLWYTRPINNQPPRHNVSKLRLRSVKATINTI